MEEVPIALIQMELLLQLLVRLPVLLFNHAELAEAMDVQIQLGVQFVPGRFLQHQQQQYSTQHHQ